MENLGSINFMAQSNIILIAEKTAFPKRSPGIECFLIFNDAFPTL